MILIHGGNMFVQFFLYSFSLIFFLQAFSHESPATYTPKNFHKVSKNIYRSAAPDDPHQWFQYLRDRGITTVINIKKTAHDPELCLIYGIRCVHNPVRLIPVWNRNVRSIRGLMEAFKSTIDAHYHGEKVLFHCQYGSDRTGLLALLTRMHQFFCYNEKPISSRNRRRFKRSLRKQLITGKFKDYLFSRLSDQIFTWIDHDQLRPDWICSPPKN